MPDSHAVFGLLTVKGRELHAELDSIQRKGHTYVPLPGIAPRYITHLGTPGWAAIAGIQHTMLREAGQPADGYVMVSVENPPASSGWNQPYYDNYVHKDGRVILCMFNFASNDLLLGIPARMYGPELKAAHGGDAKALEAI